jgi:hypothetical protein
MMVVNFYVYVPTISLVLVIVGNSRCYRPIEPVAVLATQPGPTFSQFDMMEPDVMLCHTTWNNRNLRHPA